MTPSFQHGDARLRDLEDRRANRPFLPDHGVVDVDSRRRQVLADGRKLEEPAQLPLPPPDVFDRVGVDRLVGAPVHFPIGLIVALEVHSAGPDGPGGGRLPDGARRALPLKLEFARTAHVHREKSKLLRHYINPYNIELKYMNVLSRQRHYILLALSGRDLHGSGIARAVLEETEGELRLWPATLYGTLELMARDGLIEELEDGERPEESEKRRYYRITRLGEKALARETERLARLVKTARQNLRRRDSEAS